MPEHIAIRTATKADIPAIVALRELVAGELRWIGARPGMDPVAVAERYELSLHQKDTEFFVVAPDVELDGFLSVELASYGVAELGMFVRGESRGRGIGAALLSAAIDWARANEAHKVALECWPHNTAAVSLYRKFGFVEEGRKRRHYRRGGEGAWDSIIMGLLLDPDIPGSPYDE